MSKVLVIGAGITGACFTKTIGPEHVKIFEKEAVPGGKCRSYSIKSPLGRFVFDIGGHWFHCQSYREVSSMFKDLLLYIRKSYIYLNGKYIPYPIQKNFHQIEDEVLVQSVTKELEVCRQREDLNCDLYIKMLKQRYGQTLFDLFFKPYNAKLFGKDNFNQLLVGWYEKKRNVSAKGSQGYNNTFLYGSQGSGIQILVKQLLENTTVQYHAAVSSIDMKAKQMWLENGEKYNYDFLVSTMPLKSLLLCLQNDIAAGYADCLRHSSSYIYNLGIISDKWNDMNWVYYPDADLPFYRIGSYSSVDRQMAPDNCQSLYLESTQVLSRRTILHILMKLGYIQRPEDLLVMDTQYLHESYCFYHPALLEIHSWLRSHGIYSIGRYGGWKWTSMHEDMFEAITVAKELQGK